MSPWLPEILLFDDAAPHAAALNMAIDEALLGVIAGPVLRVYRWERPAVSFGYFERWEPVRAAWPGRDAVRRWTGGGVVPHGEDLTYSLLIPGAPGMAAGNSYAVIHGALCAALGDAGIGAEAVAQSAEKISQACFENPVLHDVVAGGRKIAGAAQRRTRLGLIHQGSIQGVELPGDFPGMFAQRLAAHVERRELEIPAAAEPLATGKYGTREWLERRM